MTDQRQVPATAEPVTATGGAIVAELRRRWLPGALVGMIFLVFPAVDIITGPYGLSVSILGLVVLVITGVCYLVVTPAAMLWSIKRQWALLGGLLLLSLGLWPAAGSGLVVVWVFTAITAGAIMSMRNTAVVAVILAAAMLLLSRVDRAPPPWELAGVVVGLSLWMCAFMGNVRLTRELRQTRQELAVVAVAAERARIGRDLHDLLGHSLTAIAVKAGLARRMMEQGATGMLDEITGIERLAREALADVRATASGFREVSLGTEIAVAATVLRSSGISPKLPGAVDEVKPAARELFGYVVREAVTNVVRHAGAQHCTITLGADWVEVRDDGSAGGLDTCGPSAESPDGYGPAAGGSGLAGLGERVTEAGGTLEAGPVRGGGFLVRAQLLAVKSSPPAPPSVAAIRPTPAVAQPER